MEQVNDIFKLWINVTSKHLFIESDQKEKFEYHSNNLPALHDLPVEVPEDDRIERSDGYYPFRIAVYYSKELDDKSFKDNKINTFSFFQNKLIGQMGGVQSELDADFSPIIHIFEDKEEIRQVFFDAAYYQYHKFAPRFRAIVDSSIWNYFLIKDADLENIINKIYNNYDAHYYDLFIAKEYADLNARVAKESYLYIDPLNDNGNSGHAADVAPFLFHSEQAIKDMREKDTKKYKDSVLDITNYQWRILLVDDKINDAYLQSSDDGKVSKDMIIKDRIEYLFGEKDSCECVFLQNDEKQEYNIQNAFNTINTGKNKVVILCVDNIEKAKVALKNYKFDFILLDYLLDRDDPKNEAEKRRYGYELLKDLKTDLKQYIIGPSNRYFFMFISAFTTAISERLRLEGLFRSEKYWHIAEGACPTNTPELFCYNLQKMMIKRIEDAGIETISNDKILDTVKDIYAHEDIDSVRKQANDKYHDILSMWYYYDKIRKDVKFPEFGKSIFTTNQSVLMTSYLQGKRSIGGLLEHLVNLVHLTAFGTARQWPELWEECRFFTRTFEWKDEKQDQKLREISKKIEDYIINLKSE